MHRQEIPDTLIPDVAIEPLREEFDRPACFYWAK
jgi:hypothetical protein